MTPRKRRTFKPAPVAAKNARPRHRPKGSVPRPFRKFKVPLKIEFPNELYERMQREKFTRGTTFRHMIQTALGKYLNDPAFEEPTAAAASWTPGKEQIALADEIRGYLRRMPVAYLRLVKEKLKLDVKYYRSARIKPRPS